MAAKHVVTKEDYDPNTATKKTMAKAKLGGFIKYPNPFMTVKGPKTDNPHEKLKVGNKCMKDPHFG